MSAPGLACFIADWFANDDVKWEAPDDVVAWAQSCGDDLERAWQESRRADHLMALAGATNGPIDDVVTVACIAARAAMRFVPEREERPARALRFAMTYRPTAGILADPELVEAQQLDLAPIFDQLEAEEAECLERKRAVRVEVEQAFAARFAELAGAAGSAEAATRAANALDALLAEPATAKLYAAERERRRILACASAVRAAQAVLVIASSAATAIKARRLANHLLRLPTAEPAADAIRAEDVMKALVVANRSTARVFTEAAVLFHHAANAFGYDAAAQEDTWRAAVSALFTATPQALGSQAATPSDVLMEVLDEAGQREAAARLSEFANAVRRKVRLMPQRPRAMLRRGIAGLEPIAALLGGAEVIEPLALSLAVLDAPGPLDRRRLATALGTLHERIAAMLERERNDRPEMATPDFERTVVAARAAVQEMRDVLEALPEEKAN